MNTEITIKPEIEALQKRKDSYTRQLCSVIRLALNQSESIKSRVSSDYPRTSFCRID